MPTETNLKTRIQTIATLGRLPNVPSVVGNGWTGWFLAGGDCSWGLVWFTLGAIGLYLGGTTLNDAFDASFDRKYRPERPIPTGKFSRRQVGWIGTFWLLLGAGIIGMLSVPSIPLLFALVACILLYDIFHKKSVLAMVPMAGARALLILLAGSAALGEGLPPMGTDGDLIFFWASVHFLYVAGITWLAAGESGPKKSAQTSAITILLGTPLAAALILPLIAPPGGMSLFLYPALLLFLFIWIVPYLPLLRTNRGSYPYPRGIPRLLTGIILIDSVALSSVSLFWAVAAAAFLLPVARLLQKRIPAT